MKVNIGTALPTHARYQNILYDYPEYNTHNHITVLVTFEPFRTMLKSERGQASTSPLKKLLDSRKMCMSNSLYILNL